MNLLKSLSALTVRKKDHCASQPTGYPSEEDRLRRLPQVDRSISPNDGMYNGNIDTYLNCGLSAVINIENALAAAGNMPVKSVLDFASGYGRVLRHLVASFPKAEFTASEIEADALSYCQATFGTNIFLSGKNLNELSMGRTFDLIWSGSLMTHLDEDNAVNLLNFFHRHTRPGGLAVFSTHGKFVLNQLVEQWKEVVASGSDEHPYGLYREDVDTIVSLLEKTGYGYANYWGQDRYGISVCSQEWMQRTLDRLGGWRLVYFRERSWNKHHDVVGLVKV